MFIIQNGTELVISMSPQMDLQHESYKCICNVEPYTISLI
jgi:hypothetical protein